MPWRHELNQQHEQRRRQNRWRQRRVLGSAQGRTVTIDGQRLLNFCSNDYLGLASHDLLKAAESAATERFGAGAGASHLVSGHSEVHVQLEQKLATFVGAESAIAFSTGYMANLAVPQTFLGRHDLLLEDRLSHASLLDAGALSLAKLKRYPHCDVEAVERLLHESNAQRKLVFTDGVFSMDGDVAPVKELADVCQRADALLVVDDAHGFGVLGERGAGLLEREQVPVGGNVLMVGTLGKAAGSFGAFVAGDAVYIETLLQFARPYIYTTALPASVAAASLAAIECFEAEPERRERLGSLIEQFRQRASVANLPLQDSHTAIQPVLLGADDAALAADQLLRESGILAIAIRPPTVPENSARIRFTLRADHANDDLDELFNVLTSSRFQNLLPARDAQ